MPRDVAMRRRADRGGSRAAGALLLAAAVAAVAAGCATAASAPPAPAESRIAGDVPAGVLIPADEPQSLFDPPWVWNDERNDKVSLARWRGHMLVVGLVYTACTSTCPITIARLQRMDKELQHDGREAEFVLVTLDPAADSVDDLRRFKESSGLPAAWHLLRGSEGETQELADFLRLKIMNDGSHIIHEAKIAIVGADGRLMGHIRG